MFAGRRPVIMGHRDRRGSSQYESELGFDERAAAHYLTSQGVPLADEIVTRGEVTGPKRIARSSIVGSRSLAPQV